MCTRSRTKPGNGTGMGESWRVEKKKEIEKMRKKREPRTDGR
jgi:hypothetical protein